MDYSKLTWKYMYLGVVVTPVIPAYKEDAAEQL